MMDRKKHQDDCRDTNPRPGCVAFRAAQFAILLHCLALAGCATRGQIDLLEAQLRNREDSVRQLQTQLESVRHERDLAQRELAQLRTSRPGHHPDLLLPEQSAALARLEGIRFNELLTGGVDQDGIQGEDALAAILIPHDKDGDPVKVPGTLHVELLDLSRRDPDREAGTWTYTPTEAMELWHSGLVGQGYRLLLPWQSASRSKQLVIHAQFTTVDGRQFDATLPVEVQPASSTEDLRSQTAGGPNANQASPAGQEETVWQTGLRGALQPANPPTEESLDVNPFAEPALLRTSDSWNQHSIPRLR